MSGNGISTNPVELTLGALEGQLSQEAQGVIQPSSQNPFAGGPSMGDPFFDLPQVPQMPSPKPSRGEVRSLERAADRTAMSRVSPALRRFGEISRLVPGAERVRVRKRLNTGQIGPIGEWSLRDIQTSGDLEGFLMQYVRPKWKGGDYYLAVIDGAGREHDAGTIPLPEPPSDLTGGAPSSEGHLDLVRELVNKMERNMQPTVAPDPIEQFKRTKELLAELQGNTQSGGNNDAMLAAVLMAQRPTTPDPTMVQLLERLSGEVASLKQQVNAAPSAALAPLPPPPPAFDMQGLTTLLSTVAVPIIIKLMERNNHDDRPSFRDMIELIDRRRDGNEFTAKEAIALMRDLQSGTQQQSLQDKMQELAALREIAQQIGGGGGNGPSQTTFWDALAAFAGNPRLGDALGRVLGQEINARRAGPQPVVVQSMPAQPRPLPHLVPQPTLPHQAPQAAPQPAAPPAQPAQPAQQRVAIPDGFDAYAKRIHEAKDEEALVLVVLEALNHMRNHPQWAPFVNTMLEGAMQNDKPTVLRGLGNWSTLFARNGVLPPDAPERIVKAFEMHWEAIHATLSKMVAGGVQNMAQPTPADATTAPAAPPDAPAEPADDLPDEPDEGADAPPST